MGKKKAKKVETDSEAEADSDTVHMEDQLQTRCTDYLTSLSLSQHLINLLSPSAASPGVDESDVGTRDSKLLDTYEGLPNIRYVCFCMVYMLYKFLIYPCSLAQIKSWSDAIGEGGPSYTKFIEDFPKINKK